MYILKVNVVFKLERVAIHTEPGCLLGFHKVLNLHVFVQERVPSWTDRILYKAGTVKAELRSYGAIDSLKTSDHRPVKTHLTFKNLL